MMAPQTDPRRRTINVRINPLKLEGGPLTDSENSGTTIVIETRLLLRKKLQSLLSRRKVLRKSTSMRVVGENDRAVTWDEYDGVLMCSCRAECDFDLSFVVLRKVERKGEESEKWEEMGRVGMKSEELGKRKEMENAKMLPIRLKSRSWTVSLATLTVVVSITVEEGEASKVGVFKRIMSYGKKSKKKKLMKTKSVGRVESSRKAGELTRSASLPSSDTHSSGIRLAFWREWSFFSGSRRKVEPLMKKMDALDEPDEARGNSDETGTWEEKKIVSRDGEVELKCSVALATFDQRSEEVAGEGACSVIAAEVAHWLHLNQERVPNRRELDMLMVAGADEWKKLGENAANLNRFPDKHFDMETVLRTGTIPLEIVQEDSVVGFFSPEKFELVKGALCFDGIWDLIQSKCGVYIVSWNDHFCVLKVEGDACYVIDSLGERLQEGCKQAFILKFDESSVMIYDSSQLSPDTASKKTQDATTAIVVETEIEVEAGVIDPVAGVGLKDEKEENLIICRGRECCKEFFKRFLAAIPVTNLETKAEEGILNSSDLHRRLQIEFQYTICIVK